MFPLPIRMMVRVKPASPIIQRLMSWGMSWMMDNQDGKVEAGQALKEISKVELIMVFRKFCMSCHFGAAFIFLSRTAVCSSATI